MKVYLSAYRHKNSLLNITSITAIYSYVDELPVDLLNLIHSCNFDKLKAQSKIYNQLLEYQTYFRYLEETVTTEQSYKHDILVKKKAQNLALRLATQERNFEPLEIIQNKTIAASSDLNIKVEIISNYVPELKLAYLLTKTKYLRFLKELLKRYSNYSNQHGFRACDSHYQDILEHGLTYYHDQSHIEDLLIKYVSKEIINHTKKGEELVYVLGSLPEWWKNTFKRQSFKECVDYKTYDTLMKNSYINSKYVVQNFYTRMCLPCRFKFSKKFINFLNENKPYTL